MREGWGRGGRRRLGNVLGLASPLSIEADFWGKLWCQRQQVEFWVSIFVGVLYKESKIEELWCGCLRHRLLCYIFSHHRSLGEFWKHTRLLIDCFLRAFSNDRIFFQHFFFSFLLFIYYFLYMYLSPIHPHTSTHVKLLPSTNFSCLINNFHKFLLTLNNYFITPFHF